MCFGYCGLERRFNTHRTDAIDPNKQSKESKSQVNSSLNQKVSKKQKGGQKRKGQKGRVEKVKRANNNQVEWYYVYSYVYVLGYEVTEV